MDAGFIPLRRKLAAVTFADAFFFFGFALTAFAVTRFVAAPLLVTRPETVAVRFFVVFTFLLGAMSFPSLCN
jgi:hypothetical protein